MEDEPTSPIPATQSGDTEPQPAVKLPSQGGVQPPPPAPPWSPTPAASPKRIAKILGHHATGWFVAALMVGAVSGLSVAVGERAEHHHANGIAIPPSCITSERVPGALRRRRRRPEAVSRLRQHEHRKGRLRIELELHDDDTDRLEAHSRRAVLDHLPNGRYHGGEERREKGCRSCGVRRHQWFDDQSERGLHPR